MGKKVVTDVIKRPVEEVFAYMTEFDRARQWNPNLEEIIGHSGPVKVGSTWVEIERSWGNKSKLEHEVLELVPNKRIVLRVKASGFSMIHSSTFEPAGTDTRVTSTVDYTISGFLKTLKIIGPLPNYMIGRYMKKYLRWFKQACEAEADKL